MSLWTGKHKNGEVLKEDRRLREPKLWIKGCPGNGANLAVAPKCAIDSRVIGKIGCEACVTRSSSLCQQSILKQRREQNQKPAAEHVTADELMDYFEHSLSQEQQVVVEEHLAQCDKCTARGRQLRQLSEAWDGWSARNHARDLRSRSS